MHRDRFHGLHILLGYRHLHFNGTMYPSACAQSKSPPFVHIRNEKL